MGGGEESFNWNGVFEAIGLHGPRAGQKEKDDVWAAKPSELWPHAWGKCADVVAKFVAEHNPQDTPGKKREGYAHVFQVMLHTPSPARPK